MRCLKHVFVRGALALGLLASGSGTALLVPSTARDASCPVATTAAWTTQARSHAQPPRRPQEIAAHPAATAGSARC